MAEELIGMEDMEKIFEVTDALGIHRESVRVELTKVALTPKVAIPSAFPLYMPPGIVALA